jgi:hypothetical protein
METAALLAAINTKYRKRQFDGVLFTSDKMMWVGFGVRR